MDKSLVAMQVGAISFADEGVSPVLEKLQSLAGVNALFLATPTWTRGTGGRQVPGHGLPDHGAQVPDPEFMGGSYAATRAEYYRSTSLGAPDFAAELPGYDMFEDVLPEARARGMKSYAWMEESGYTQALRDIPGFPRVLEVDIWGRPAHRPCFNNPDYKNWWLGVVEDYAKNYDLDGMAWCSERPGPLNMIIQGRVVARGVSCFCRYCADLARERGIDVERAKAGYRELLDWNGKAADKPRRGDGAFTTFWRILLRYPEILAWQHLWTESQRQMYRDIYGVAKASKFDLEVGWHVYHDISFSPFYRADQDFAALAETSDFIKLVAYNNCAGPRFHTWIASITRSLFADLDPEEAYPFILKLLNLEEGAYADLPQSGFSADYVRRETARAVEGVAGAAKIYTGIDIDIPVGMTKENIADRKKRNESVTGVNNDATVAAEDLASCTREGVRDAVLAAYDGGADGLVLSRKYSEMRLDVLAGTGDALRELERR